MNTLSLINQTIANGFPWLTFPKPLERKFQGFVRQRVLNRVVVVGTSAALFIIVFSMLDWLMLHPALALHTSIVRLLIVLPVIIIVTAWLYFKPPKYYLWIYASTLFISNLSIIYIIWLAHIQGVNLPYEGLMITMMYGFFIMALPFYLALSINISMVLIYAITEPLYYLSFTDYLNHVLFLSIILISAAIGAYVTEHNQRANFLRKLTLDLHHKQTLFSIQQKNKYLASASHDIRQPLHGISLMGRYLSQTHPNDEHIRQLNKGIHALNTMFNQMLDISKINLNLIQPRIEPTSIFEIIEQLHQTLSKRCEILEIAIQLDILDETVMSDYTLLSRIINNLIENALVHSQCSQIDITTKRLNNEIKLTIRDNGHGIDQSLQTTMFNEFSKGGHSADGLGLGLTIVFQFCEKLDHKLTFTSKPGETEFSIFLPISKIDRNQLSNINQDNSILLVDDDPMVLKTLSNQLEEWGYCVTCASSLQHAFALINKSFSLIITDWNLGDGCSEKLLKKSLEISVPSILISTDNQDDLKAISEQFDAYFIKKPISPSRLKAALLKTIKV